MSKCDDCFIYNNDEFSGMECCSTNCNDVKKWLVSHDKQIRDDEREKILTYLVDNGYIKYGFDVEYLEKQLRGGENE